MIDIEENQEYETSLDNDAGNEEDELDAQQPEQYCAMVQRNFEPFDIGSQDYINKPSLEQPLASELRSLPTHSKYAYLGDGNTPLVIISATLTADNESTLLKVLKKYIQAIGWTLANIRGINPLYCMHKIRLEERKDGSIEHQHKLNPSMKDVVKKEILKWLVIRRKCTLLK